jgi:protein TonB
MSKTRLISALTARVAVLVAACWLATGTFPLTAAPQVRDDPGVTVAMNGASLLHRAPVDYPVAAVRAGIQGILSVEVKLDAKGNVADARVLSGPDELRKTTLQSVLQWHFTSDSAGVTRVVQITFDLANAQPQFTGAQSATVSAGVQARPYGGMSITASRVSGGMFGRALDGSPLPPPPPGEPEPPLRIQHINVDGLSQQARDELISRLPVHEGDIYSNDTLQKMAQAAKDFDEHLTTRFQGGNGNGVSIQILAPGAQPPVPQMIKVGGNVQAAMVLKRVTPVYPDSAKSLGVEGVVHLAVIIAKDGTVQEVHVLGGHPLLVQSAMDAVRQWVYRPTLLNGQPVQVETTVDVNFTLAQ